MSDVSRNEQARLRRHRRVRKKVHGTTSRPRLSVFRSQRHSYAQIIDDSSARTLAAASTLEADLRGRLDKGRTVVAAREVGVRLASLATARGIRYVVFDRNGYQYHGRMKALAEGARDGGLEF